MGKGGTPSPDKRARQGLGDQSTVPGETTILLHRKTLLLVLHWSAIKARSGSCKQACLEGCGHEELASWPRQLCFVLLSDTSACAAGKDATETESRSASAPLPSSVAPDRELQDMSAPQRLQQSSSAKSPAASRPTVSVSPNMPIMHAQEADEVCLSPKRNSCLICMGIFLRVV